MKVSSSLAAACYAFAKSCAALEQIAFDSLLGGDTEDLAQALEAVLDQENAALEEWDALTDVNRMKIRQLEDAYSYVYETPMPTAMPTTPSGSW